MLALLGLAATFAPTPLTARPHAFDARAASVVASAADLITGWQPAALSKVVSTLALSPKDYAADCGFDSFVVKGSTGKVESFEGPGAPNIAWCSGLTLSGPELSRGSVTAFCGPLTDVPHLIASCGISDGGIDLYIDWRPRAEGAYDPAYATLAEYPDPDTREAFAEGGNRKDFAAAFFTDEVVEWRAKVRSYCSTLGTKPLTRPSTAASIPEVLLLPRPLPPRGCAAGPTAPCTLLACPACVPCLPRGRLIEPRDCSCSPSMVRRWRRRLAKRSVRRSRRARC